MLLKNLRPNTKLYPFDIHIKFFKKSQCKNTIFSSTLTNFDVFTKATMRRMRLELATTPSLSVSSEGGK